MPLPGFEKATIVHISANSNQKISLAPVSLRMEMGGDNASWRCDMAFFIGDKDKQTLGAPVRGRSLNLHTRDPALATARALQTLAGVRSRDGEQWFDGFLIQIRKHMEKTGHDWRKQKVGKKTKDVFIGDEPLQFQLDDMRRYDRDIGVKLDRQETNPDNNVIITLQALRCLRNNQANTVIAKPEYVYERGDDGHRRPISFQLTIPGTHRGRIPAFVQEVDFQVFKHADEIYSSLAEAKDELMPPKRKRPTKYRASQIRQGVIRAVEGLFRATFRREAAKEMVCADR